MVGEHDTFRIMRVEEQLRVYQSFTVDTLKTTSGSRVLLKSSKNVREGRSRLLGGSKVASWPTTTQQVMVSRFSGEPGRPHLSKPG